MNGAIHIFPSAIEIKFTRDLKSSLTEAKVLLKEAFDRVDEALTYAIDRTEYLAEGQQEDRETDTANALALGSAAAEKASLRLTMFLAIIEGETPPEINGPETSEF